MPAHASTVAFPLWSVFPFLALLLAIALLPLVAEPWWKRNRNKALVGVVFGLPAAAWAAMNVPERLGHQAADYVAFVALIGALFVVSGGIQLRAAFSGRPASNATILAAGAVLANVVGTTGASVLLIRPFLLANRHRREKSHLVVFFIFVVSNMGGLLTPLGDPPLFLGFLSGVPFEWTLIHLWPKWLFAVGACLAVFLAVDAARHRGEPPAPLHPHHGLPIAVKGAGNVALLLLVVAAVFAGGAWVGPKWGELAGKVFQAVSLSAIAGISLATTPQDVRRANEFTWHPFVEVAVLFAGIFAAMIPALGVLEANRARLGVTEPWHYFWATGAMSSVLDNAPTYLIFRSLAGEGVPAGPVLAAISCGAVLFGAMTYIGNGPNFLVKAIAEHSGVRTPSFFGYVGWALAVLGPLFVALTLIFFR